MRERSQEMKESFIELIQSYSEELISLVALSIGLFFQFEGVQCFFLFVSDSLPTVNVSIKSSSPTMIDQTDKFFSMVTSFLSIGTSIFVFWRFFNKKRKKK
tara:strand:+ start:802 stop:1104 length:303 start_codon:yes stop_codon:yes gene_type:complete